MIDLEKILELEEGLRLKPYVDTVGKITIGMGRNLSDKGITRDEALFLLKNDIAEASEEIKAHLPWFFSLTESQQAALTDLAFNMGIGGLMAFKAMLSNLKSGNIPGAIAELKNSKWWNQVGNQRKEDLVNLMNNKSVKIL